MATFHNTTRGQQCANNSSPGPAVLVWQEAVFQLPCKSQNWNNVNKITSGLLWDLTEITHFKWKCPADAQVHRNHCSQGLDSMVVSPYAKVLPWGKDKQQSVGTRCTGLPKTTHTVSLKLFFYSYPSYFFGLSTLFLESWNLYGWFVDVSPTNESPVDQ